MPNCDMSGAQGEICKAAEAGAMTTAESNRAVPDSVGEQGHTSESKEGAEHCCWKKTKGGEGEVNIDTCSEAANVSPGQQLPGTGSIDSDVWQGAGSSWRTWSTAPQVPTCQAQGNVSVEGQRQTRQGVVAGSLRGWGVWGLLFQQPTWMDTGSLGWECCVRFNAVV